MKNLLVHLLSTLRWTIRLALISVHFQTVMNILAGNFFLNFSKHFFISSMSAMEVSRSCKRL
eukprot:UN00073